LGVPSPCISVPSPPRPNGTPAQWHPRTRAQWAMGAQPRARTHIPSSLHNVYYATRFWAPEHWTLAPRAPRSTAARTAAPTRRCTAAPQHRCTAAPLHRTPHHAPPPPAPPGTPRGPTGPHGPPMGESESRRHGRGGVVRGGLPYAYREKRHFPDAGSYTSPIYKPNMRPICAYMRPICAQYAPICAQYAPNMRLYAPNMRLYASVCPYPCGGRFISPEKPKK
jgi:hypothetical protein